MNQPPVPSAPLGESVGGALPPPSYDEAMGNLASGPKDENVPNPIPVTDALQDENELKKRDQKKEAPPLTTASPLVTSQPLPLPETTYSFQQSVTQQPQPASDCCMGIYCLDGENISDICYGIFCCPRHMTGHDAGCCHCGDGCCGCPEGCCECGDCDCDCGGCDCDCGDCDCDCDCGDCTIM